MIKNRFKLIVFVGACCIGLSVYAHAEDTGGASGWQLHDPLAPCNGDCAIHVYGGQFTDTSMFKAFGLDGFTPIWDWDFKDSYLIAGAFSRKLLSYRDIFDVEAEAGVGQRFGQMHATEIWSALYFRWKAFPWNKSLYTTVAVSTGLSYATEIEDLARVRDGKRQRGSKLLHFLSPEITFALPENPNTELVLRYHHRSGGADIFGNIGMFNNVSGGAQHATVGVRVRF